MSTSLAPSNTKFRIHELGIIFCFYKDIKHIAFLNYKEGGAIYVGINKSGQAVGIDNIDQAQLQIKDRIKNNIQPSTLGLFDVTVETIDSKALKEAVINAMVHSDYTLTTTPIIELYSDRIEITSGGGLPQGLSQEEFLEGVTAPRNKELIRVFKDVDLIENIGSGVLRILDAYDKKCFNFMEHFLRVSFKYRENPFEYDKETTQETTQEILSYLNVNQLKILKLIKLNPSITQKEIANELNITRDGVKYNISILKNKNVITREGSTKNGTWKVLQ